MAERHPRLAVVPVCASVVLALLLAATALAQAPGRVTGVVRDEDEQPIKGATVTAQNTSVGLSYTSSTDEKGRFFLIGLRPGDWAFVAGAPGFAATGSRMNVRAASNLNPPLLFTLRRNGPGAGGALERLTGKDLQDKLENADKLFAQKKYDDAISAYRSIMSSAAPLAFLNLQIAAAYVAKNDLGRAQSVYEDLLKVDASNEKALVGIAEIKQKQGNARAAQEFLLKAAESADTGREVFLALGEMAAAAGQPEEAANWFTKASAADPYWGRPLYRLAQLASAKGDTAAAEGFMQRTIAVDPSSPEAGLARNALGQSGL